MSERDDEKLKTAIGFLNHPTVFTQEMRELLDEHLKARDQKQSAAEEIENWEAHTKRG